MNSLRRNSPALLLLALLAVACSPDQGQAPPEKTDGGEPIARLGDELIYRNDVAPAVAFQIYRRQVDIYSLLRGQAEELVDSRVIEGEAKRRNISEEDLFRREVDDKIAPVTEEEIDAYIAEHPDEASGGKKEVRPRIRYFLQESRSHERRLSFLKELREKAGFEILLERPEEPRTRIDTEGAPARGNPDAPVTLVHFATFNSALSARSEGYLSRLMKEFPGKLRWIHRHFLNPHDEMGLMAAEFAVAAQDEQLFWKAHDGMFALGGEVDEEKLRRLAEEIGLPGEQLLRVGIDEKYLARVKRDIDAGVKAGVRREPVVYVNGRYFSSTFPFENLRQIVREELGERPVSNGSPAGTAPQPGG